MADAFARLDQRLSRLLPPRRSLRARREALGAVSFYLVALVCGVLVARWYDAPLFHEAVGDADRAYKWFFTLHGAFSILFFLRLQWTEPGFFAPPRPLAEDPMAASFTVLCFGSNEERKVRRLAAKEERAEREGRDKGTKNDDGDDGDEEKAFSSFPTSSSSSSSSSMSSTNKKAKSEPRGDPREWRRGEDPLPFCKLCEVEMPIRARHCRQCNACVARFDHHCAFIGNCVGQGNHRWFFSYLPIQATWCLLALIELLRCWIFYDTILEQLVFNYPLIPFLIATFLFFIMPLWLFAFHGYLIMTAQTTWENESDRVWYMKGVPEDTLPFDRGITENCKDFFTRPMYEKYEMTVPNDSNAIQRRFSRFMHVCC